MHGPAAGTCWSCTAASGATGARTTLAICSSGSRARRWNPSPSALPRCSCGALLRPDVVWFGEPLNAAHLDAATTAVSLAELVFVVGTSSVVYPAAALPGVAQRAGARVIEINPEETPVSQDAHVAFRGPAGVLLPALEELAFGPPAPIR